MTGPARVALVLAALWLAAPAHGQSTDQAREIFLAYARLRDRLYLCQMGRVQDTLGDEDKRDCRRLKRRYRLYTWPGEGYFPHVHCLGWGCPRTPEGEPAADGTYPPDAVVYR